MEIAPAFLLDPHLRDRLHADAVNLAKQVRFANATKPMISAVSSPPFYFNVMWAFARGSG